MSYLDSRPISGEAIATIFGVEAHLVTYDLPPGYWQRAEARRVARARIRARIRRWIASKRK